MRRLMILVGFFLALGVAPALAQSAFSSLNTNVDPENTLVMEIPEGRVVIQMLPNVAPKHVAQIKTLTRQGFYDGIVFHRVIPGFMAQTGDPTGTGMGGSKLPDIPAEFSSVPFVRGTVGMARAGSPDSGNSQFFICFDDARFLDGEYTVWGKVVEGMDAVDKIAPGEPPKKPDAIISMKVMADE